MTTINIYLVICRPILTNTHIIFTKGHMIYKTFEGQQLNDNSTQYTLTKKTKDCNENMLECKTHVCDNSKTHCL